MRPRTIFGLSSFEPAGRANSCCVEQTTDSEAANYVDPCCAFLYSLHRPVPRIGGNVLRRTTILKGPART